MERRGLQGGPRVVKYGVAEYTGHRIEQGKDRRSRPPAKSHSTPSTSPMRPIDAAPAMVLRLYTHIGLGLLPSL
eukprot:2943991-Prymnesium_polylepis.1